MTNTARTALILTMICNSLFAAELEMKWSDKPVRQLFDDQEGTYNYCASAILDNGIEYYFYCANTDPYKVVDHIALSKLRHSDGGLLLHKQIMLAPNGQGWDAQHDCDPTVAKGLFRYQETDYKWVMFFLGEDYSKRPCLHNQIGVAFANDSNGPWVRWAGNPVVGFDSYDSWGAGQASVINLDEKGKLLLLYTLGVKKSKRVLCRVLDFSDMTNPVIGEPQPVTVNGLMNSKGVPRDGLDNADFMYDPERKMFFVVRPRHPFANKWPPTPGDVLQIACIDEKGLLNNEGSWQVLGHIDKPLTGFERNHNGCFLRDSYGRIPDPNRLTVIFAKGECVKNWWFSYRLYRLDATISEK